MGIATLHPSYALRVHSFRIYATHARSSNPTSRQQPAGLHLQPQSGRGTSEPPQTPQPESRRRRLAIAPHVRKVIGLRAGKEIHPDISPRPRYKAQVQRMARRIRTSPEGAAPKSLAKPPTAMPQTHRQRLPLRQSLKQKRQSTLNGSSGPLALNCAQRFPALSCALLPQRTKSNQANPLTLLTFSGSAFPFRARLPR